MWSETVVDFRTDALPKGGLRIIERRGFAGLTKRFGVRVLVLTVAITVLALCSCGSADRVATADAGRKILMASRGRDHRYMLVTAYCSCPVCTGKSAGDPGYGITASGVPVFAGLCAADPDIPFGTVLRVEGIGRVVVADRGGAVRGARLDVYMPSHEAALAWGARWCRVETVGKTSLFVRERTEE